MEIVNYALCSHKCRKSKNCLRYINRNSNEKAVLNFKQVCNPDNEYRWFYSSYTEKKLKQKLRKKEF